MIIATIALVTKQETCEGCGTVFNRPTGKRLHRCFDCRMLGYAANTTQSRLKQGVYYENTVRGQLAHWKMEAERLGIEV
jgi:hypothetical protein